MEWIYILLKSLFILLGIIAVLLGKYLPKRLFLPNLAKDKVLDENHYINSGRLILYGMGFYYILLGIVLLFIKEWPGLINFFVIIMPVIIVAVISSNRRKYIRPSSQLRNDKD
jgi:hypothetical protein